MPSLFELDLSYNALTGTLPHEQLLSPTLEVICLAHNLLEGTIPGAIGSLSGTLGVDHNCFSGSAQLSDLPDQNYSFEFDAEYNRLSGRVEQHVVDASYLPAHQIYILQGNIYKCGSNGDGLPRRTHGEQTTVYQCGSYGFNNTTQPGSSVHLP